MIITYPTYKIIRYHGHDIEIPLWVNYLAMSVRPGANKANLIGFSHKPFLKVRHCTWGFNTNAVNPREEVIGYVTDVTAAYNDRAFHLRTLTKVGNL